MWSRSGADMGGGIGSLFGSLIGQGDAGAPYGSAMNEINPFLRELQQYRSSLMPYQNQYAGVLQHLLSNPNAMVDQIMSGYHTSPYATDQMNAAKEAAHAEGALRGDLGTPQEQERVGQKVGQIADADENQYLSHALGLFSQGLGGMGGLTSQIPGLFQDEGYTVGNLAALLAQQQAAQQRQQQQDSSGIWGGIGSLIGGFL